MHNQNECKQCSIQFRHMECQRQMASIFSCMHEGNTVYKQLSPTNVSVW